MRCPCCDTHIADELVISMAASINGKKGNKGGARKGAGRPKKIQTTKKTKVTN